MPLFRTNRLCAAMLLMGLADGAHALGLADVTLNSSLFQPLEAEIRLIGSNELALDDLRATLADPAAFQRAGLPRPHFLTGLRMELRRVDAGDVVLRVSSGRPVVEPILAFLVDLEWPHGRVRKQYTLLLNPPGSMPATQQQPAEKLMVATSDSAEIRPRERASRKSAHERVESVAPPTAAPSNSAPQVPASHRVQPNDTLSRIADRYLDDYGVTRNQLMAALVKENPHAFIQGNMNGLKALVDLTLPTRQAVNAYTVAAGDALVREQYAAWKQRNNPAPSEAAARAQEPAPEAASAARLSLSPTVADVEPGASFTADETLSPEQRRLERELFETRQQLYDREAELDVMRSRMAVYEAELGRLKNALASIAAHTNQPAPVSEPLPTASLLPSRTDTQFLLSGVLLGLSCAALIALLRRSARRREAPASAALTETGQAMNTALEDEPTAEKTVVQPAEVSVEHDPQMHQADILAVLPLVNADTASATTHEPAATDENDGVDGDVILSETDVLIQFGDFERARELMQEALRGNPENPFYRIKLMEICHAMEDAESFLQHASVLRGELTEETDALWRDAEAMATTLCPESFAALTNSRDSLEEERASPGYRLAEALINDQLPVLSQTGVNRLISDPDEMEKLLDWSFEVPHGDENDEEIIEVTFGSDDLLLPDLDDGDTRREDDQRPREWPLATEEANTGSDLSSDVDMASVTEAWNAEGQDNPLSTATGQWSKTPLAGETGAMPDSAQDTRPWEPASIPLWEAPTEFQVEQVKRQWERRAANAEDGSSTGESQSVRDEQNDSQPDSDVAP